MANPKQLFERNTTWRKQVMRTLSTDVIVKGRIITTLPRAKELKSHVDKLITLGKENTLAARRRAASYLRKVTTKDSNMDSVQYLFNTVAPKYKNRNGGYTRVIKLPNRLGDNAPIAIIELV